MTDARLTIDYVGALEHNGDLFARAAEKVDHDLTVPTCPDWNLGKLLIHMGQHHRWVSAAIRGGGEAPDTPGKPGLRGAELVAWMRDGVADLADLLRSKKDDETAWTWSDDDQTVGFWRRRTSLETLVHRWDVENMTGETTPMEPALAADAVDEMLTVFAPRGSTYEGPAGRLTIATTDDGPSWEIAMTPGAHPAVTGRASGGADVTIAAPAETLCLYLWGRVGRDGIDVGGDEALSAAVIGWLEE